MRHGTFTSFLLLFSCLAYFCIDCCCATHDGGRPPPIAFAAETFLKPTNSHQTIPLYSVFRFQCSQLCRLRRQPHGYLGFDAVIILRTFHGRCTSEQCGARPTNREYQLHEVPLARGRDRDDYSVFLDHRLFYVFCISITSLRSRLSIAFKKTLPLSSSFTCLRFVDSIAGLTFIIVYLYPYHMANSNTCLKGNAYYQVTGAGRARALLHSPKA